MKPTRVARTAARSRSAMRATSNPVMRTTPEVGRSRVPMMWRSVDFPDPEGPTMATNSPASTLKLTARSA